MPRCATLAPILGLVVVLALYFALGVRYADTTPAWNNPDEPAHYNAVADLSRTGVLPVMQMGAWDEALLEREIAAQFTLNEPLDGLRYESWQPPLYYTLAVPVFHAADGAQARLLALRHWDVVLGGITLLFAYLLGREVLVCAPLGSAGAVRLPDRAWLALAVPLAMVGVPMFTAVSASVDNDALANLWGAALAFVLVRIVRLGGNGRRVLLLGLLLGCALLTKMTLAAFVALAPLAFLGACWVHRQPWRRGIVQSIEALVLALLVWSPWLVHQGLTYGWTDLLASQRHDQVVVGQPRAAGITPDYLWHWASVSFASFWGQFGWMTIVAPTKLHLLWTTATVLAALGSVLLLVRAWRCHGWSWRLIDVRTLVLLGAIAGAVAVDAAHNLEFDQAQGRFVFVALAPIVALMVLGWAALVPVRWRAWAPLLIGCGLVALNWYTLLRVVEPAWVH